MCRKETSMMWLAPGYRVYAADTLWRDIIIEFRLELAEHFFFFFFILYMYCALWSKRHWSILFSIRTRDFINIHKHFINTYTQTLHRTHIIRIFFLSLIRSIDLSRIERWLLCSCFNLYKKVNNK